MNSIEHVYSAPRLSLSRHIHTTMGGMFAKPDAAGAPAPSIEVEYCHT